MNPEQDLEALERRLRAAVAAYVHARAALETPAAKGRHRAFAAALPPRCWPSIEQALSSAVGVVRGPCRVAFLGPESTFTHMAARRHFGDSMQGMPQDTIGDVFSEVQKGKADYGVVPVENSTEGAVTHTLDALSTTRLDLSAEIYLRIAHHLMALDRDTVLQKLYSHPQVFGQCRRWLDVHMPGVERLEVSSTSRAAALAAQTPSAGALAGTLAAEMHGLLIREADVHDMACNTTRFLVIAGRAGEPTGKDKTSLCFTVKHRVGALYDALGVLKTHQINMTRIESRPSRAQAWEYTFFIDCEGHAREARMAAALQELAGHCLTLRILGSYPRVDPEQAASAEGAP